MLLPSLQGAKVAPLVDPKHATPSVESTSTPQPLGIPASTISHHRRRISSAASGLLMVPSLARELADVVKEATSIKTAVREWWDVNVTQRADEAVEREVLAELVKAIRPALRLGKVFVSLRLNRR